MFPQNASDLHRNLPKDAKLHLGLEILLLRNGVAETVRTAFGKASAWSLTLSSKRPCASGKLNVSTRRGTDPWFAVFSTERALRQPRSARMRKSE